MPPPSEDAAMGGASRGGVGDDATVSDPRFRRLHSDPRFMRFPATTKKVTIDKRFARMFEDPDFGTGGAGRRTDKRGRRTEKAKKSAADDLREYYDLDEEALLAAEKPGEGGEGGGAEEKSGGGGGCGCGGAREEERPRDRRPDRPDASSDSASSESSEPEPDALEAKLEMSRDRMRGVGLDSESDSSDDSSDDSDDSRDDRDGGSSGSEGVIPRMLAPGAGGLADDIPTSDATRRLAVVDQEWQHLRAVDILVVLRSFAPKGGEVTRVVVYPSDFGAERMRREAVEGPLAAFKPKAKDRAKRVVSRGEKNKGERRKGPEKKNREGGDSDSDSDDDEGSSSGSSSSSGSGSSSSDSDPDASRELMRQYERDRMRYYYAIVECDSADTARAVYQQCDGLEFERSACKLDLRYVPDEDDFSAREVRDEASAVPSDYEPPEFSVKALQQTNVKLSWDDDDPARRRAFSRKLTEDKLKDEDFAAYMGAGSSDDEEDEEEEEGKKGGGGREAEAREAARAKKEAERKKYLSLLLGGGGGDGAEDAVKDGSEDAESGSEGGDEADASDEDEGFTRAAWGASSEGRKGLRESDRYGNKTGSRRVVEGDMEVTFRAGLEALAEKVGRRKDAAKETTWEKALREQKEKRAAKKRRRKEEEGGAADDDPFADATIRLDDVDGDGDGEGGEGEGENKRPGVRRPVLRGGPARRRRRRRRRLGRGGVRLGGGGGRRGASARGKKKAAAARGLRRGSRSGSGDDPFALARRPKDSKRERRRREREAEADPERVRAKADLELLMMDDDAIRGGGGLTATAGGEGGGRGDAERGPTENDANRPKETKRASRKARLAAKKLLKGKHARRAESDDEAEDGAGAGGTKSSEKASRVAAPIIDTRDDRFAKLYDSHQFALDPTDPRFKEVRAAGVIAEEKARRKEKAKRRRRREDAEGGGGDGGGGDFDGGEEASGEGLKRDAEMAAMVAGLKRKARRRRRGVGRARE